MKFIFAGGGTGGHVFPAIAIADEIKKLNNSSEILFIGAKGKIEERLVPQNGYRLETLKIDGFIRGSVMTNITLPGKIVGAIYKSKKIIKSFDPQVVIGTGGFVSLPVLYSAVSLKKKTLIQEGNYFPGLSTKFLSNRVDKVIVNFEGTRNLLKRKDNVLKIGHPIRSTLRLSDKNDSKVSLGLNKDNFTVLVFGGSQGARGINTSIEKLIEEFKNTGINLIWQTGKFDFEKYKSRFEENENLKIVEFINDMSTAYSASDLVICRSGVTSIMELAYLGKAAIFVPFPGATDNHQELNARTLEKEFAGKVILQSQLEEQLLREIIMLKENPNMISRLEEGIKKFEDPFAAKKIAEEILSMTLN